MLSKLNCSAKIWLIIFLYSLLFLLSELLYRAINHITPVTSLLETFAFIFGFVLLFCFAKYRLTRLAIWFFFTLSVIANNVHYAIYENWINATQYLLLMREVTEVTHAGSSMLSQVWLPIVWGSAESLLFASLICFKAKRRIVWADLLFWLVMLFICVRSFGTSQQHGISPNPAYSRLKANYFVFGYFLGRTLPYELFHLSSVEAYTQPMPKVAHQPEIKNIIILLGESESAYHVQYFGYPRPTTPFLMQFAEQYHPVIRPTYSAAMMTAVALPTLFNAIAHPNGMVQIASGNTNLLHLAQLQGYKTYFHSAQAEGEMMIMNIIGKKWVDELTFPTQQGYQYNQHMPDDKLLPYLKQIDLDNGRHFVVLHQRGSHVPYGELLSEEEKQVFGTATTLDKYDNTIHKTDQLLQQIFTYLQQRQKEDWLLIYTSDHGQYVTANVANQGTQKAASYTVPLVMYSPNQALMQKIAAVAEPCQTMFHQQLATMLINLMGYEMPVSDCKSGVVNGNLLTGDAGYYQIDAAGANYIYPQKRHQYR